MVTRADGVTIKEAAQALRITEAAVRQRLQRRTLKSYRVDGKVYVLLPDDLDHTVTRDGVSNGVSSDVTRPYDALIEQLKAENALIREQLEIKDRQISELHILLQTAQRQLPANVPDPLESSVRPAAQSTSSEGGQQPIASPGGVGEESDPSQRSRPSWWRRFFFGEE